MRYANIIMSLFCAWVLWSNGVGVGGGGYVNSWNVLDAYEAKTECSTTAQEKEKQEIKRREEQDQDKARKYLGFAYYKCLPDTVDPRAPKASR